MKQVLTVVSGGHLTMTILIDLAQKIAALKQIPLDRAARRRKDCLICWFCENASVDALSEPAWGIDRSLFERRQHTNETPSDPFGAESDEWPWECESEEH
jgi:hypothetical protein